MIKGAHACTSWPSLTANISENTGTNHTSPSQIISDDVQPRTKFNSNKLGGKKSRICLPLKARKYLKYVLGAINLIFVVFHILLCVCNYAVCPSHVATASDQRLLISFLINLFIFIFLHIRTLKSQPKLFFLILVSWVLYVYLSIYILYTFVCVLILIHTSYLLFF